MNRDKEIFQCSCCGHIYKAKSEYKPRGDDIYVTLWCPKCKKYEKQLYCGDDEDQIYELYDINIDKRYYKY